MAQVAGTRARAAGSHGAGRGVSSPRPGWDSSRGSETFTLWLRRGLRMGVRWVEQEMAPRPGGSMGGAEPGGCQAPSRTWVWTSPASGLLGPHCLWHRLSVPWPLSLPSHRTRPSARESRGGRYLSQGPSGCGGLRLSLWRTPPVTSLCHSGLIAAAATTVPDEPMPEPAATYINVSA